FVEIPPHMNPAGGEDDIAARLQSREAGVAVDVENAREVFEMRRGPLALAVGREDEDGCRRRRATPTAAGHARMPTAARSWCDRGRDRAPASACHRRTDGPTQRHWRRAVRTAPRATSMRRRPIRPASSDRDRYRGAHRSATADTAACD